MEKISANREKLGIGIAVFFLLATTALYGFYSSDIDADIDMTGKITSNDSSMFKGFNYSLENNEDQTLEPVFYAVGPRQRGEVRMFTNRSEVAPNSAENFTALLEEDRGMIPPAGDYILILKDKRTGRIDSRIVSFDNDYLSEKNPYFVDTYGYRFHWRGSIYGDGDYNISIEDEGLNVSFRNCESTCGLTYRDEYSLTDRLSVSGVSEGLENTSSISTVVADKEFEIGFEEGENRTQRFGREINLTRHFDSVDRDEVTYQIGFKTEEEDFHWIQFNRYRFYNPE